mgnify:CR=1 FL=1
MGFRNHTTVARARVHLQLTMLTRRVAPTSSAAAQATAAVAATVVAPVAEATAANETVAAAEAVAAIRGRGPGDASGASILQESCVAAAIIAETCIGHQFARR